MVVFFKASYVANAKDVFVFVAPFDLDQQSLMPARVSIDLAVSPTTRPRPFGPGISVIVTLPLRPVTVKGSECCSPQ